MGTKTYQGSCKCGAVKFEADLDLAQGTTKCNCTSCWKRRWWSAKVAPERFRSRGGEELLSTEGGFCVRCGIVPYVQMPEAEWNDGAYVSVNVAALDGLDPRELMDAPIQYCDGLADNWWEEPEYVAHL